MERKPLPAGHEITMANGGVYRIKHLLAEGGFSLIYAAETIGGTSSVIIKEFFPAEGALRDSSGKVIPSIGNEEAFQRNLKRFETEGVIGGKLSRLTFQTISFLEMSNGFAVIQRESDDMRSLSTLVDIWEHTAPVPFTGNPSDRDPVFPDMIRIRYALRIVESVLSALESVHDNGFLHLDISGQNVIWGGRDIETGENCDAFLADFGCSVEMNSGEYYPEYQLSYSPGFAAPEVQGKCDCLSPATDLYSVGILLFYLCIGKNALEITHNRKRQIQRETAYLAIPDRIRGELQKILIFATADRLNRYQNVSLMLDDVRALRIKIPNHPYNPDNTKEFTLYSLKAMLEGSLETHYSWAHELRDRRQIEITIPEGVYTGVSWTEFQGDEEFLQTVLPEEIYDYLIDKINACPNRDDALKRVLSCNFDRIWKSGIREKINRYKTRSLLKISRSLLDDENAFFVHQGILFQLLEGDDESERLIDCYRDCSIDIRKNPYVGLAMFIVFALLGPEWFNKLLPSPQDANKLFYSL